MSSTSPHPGAAPTTSDTTIPDANPAPQPGHAAPSPELARLAKRPRTDTASEGSNAENPAPAAPTNTISPPPPTQMPYDPTKPGSSNPSIPSLPPMDSNSGSNNHNPPSLLPGLPGMSGVPQLPPLSGLQAAGGGPTPSLIQPPVQQQMHQQQPQALLVSKLKPTAQAPTRGSAFAAGYDLYAADPITIPARGKALVSTGIAVAVPVDTYGRIAPRSGLASKHFIDTGAGVIDADYRGEVKVLLFNHAETDFEVKSGDRVAQMVLERIVTPEVMVVEKLEESVRGAGGFGSTG